MGNDVATVLPKIRAYMEKEEIMSRIDKALPESMKQLKASGLIQMALTCIGGSDKLLTCSAESLAKTAIEAASYGLALDRVQGDAYPVPRNIKGVMTATLIIGYKGMIKLACQGDPSITHISSEIRHENDYFQIQFGTNRKLEHKPFDGDRGKSIGAYAVIHRLGGLTDFSYMTKEEIEAIKRKAAQGTDRSDSPWNRYTDWMWKKTVIRQLAKLQNFDVNVGRALARDEYREAGIIDNDDNEIIDITASDVGAKPMDLDGLAEKTKAAREEAEQQPEQPPTEPNTEPLPKEPPEFAQEASQDEPGEPIPASGGQTPAEKPPGPIMSPDDIPQQETLFQCIECRKNFPVAGFSGDSQYCMQCEEDMKVDPPGQAQAEMFGDATAPNRGPA